MNLAAAIVADVQPAKVVPDHAVREAETYGHLGRAAVGDLDAVQLARQRIDQQHKRHAVHGDAVGQLHGWNILGVGDQRDLLGLEIDAKDSPAAAFPIAGVGDVQITFLVGSDIVQE